MPPLNARLCKYIWSIPFFIYVLFCTNIFFISLQVHYVHPPLDMIQQVSPDNTASFIHLCVYDHFCFNDRWSSIKPGLLLTYFKSSFPPIRRLCFPCVHLLVGSFACRITQRTTEKISTKLGGRMGLIPKTTPSGVDQDKVTNPFFAILFNFLGCNT